MVTPPWMIEELERSRREREWEDARPVLHVELPTEPPHQRDPETRAPARGVIVIDL